MCAICCLSLAFSISLVVATVALTLGGAGWVVTWTRLDVSVQLSSPRWGAGRTLSIYSALSSGGIGPAAGWGGGRKLFARPSVTNITAADCNSSMSPPN
ncbi:MFS transporter [Mesorhizobium sp. M0965]|uniref:MFS transporter n=1 Tax=Mesorhizobium sp. M0965 TaxID=2957036 RepID=UPI00333E038E